MGWNGVKNGQLIQLVLENGFDVLLTFDKNIKSQQNFEKYAVKIIVLNAENNTYLMLKELVPEILKMLSRPLKTGVTIVAKG